MKAAICTLAGLSPYSQSRAHDTPKKNKESGDDYEQRTWRGRLHTTADGEVFIPPMAFKNCLAEAATYLSMKVPGKGNNTYAKHFAAGVLVTDGMRLGIHRDDVPGETLFLNSDGKRGGGTRVWRTYPRIEEWRGDVTFYILDDAITEDAFAHHLREAGSLIGIGRFRPRNNGFYGRFAVENIDWRDDAAA